MVCTVFEKREALKELFEHILEHHDEYMMDTSAQHLDNVLFNVLLYMVVDIHFCLTRVAEFCDTIERI